MTKILLKVENLKTWFDTPEGTVRAVDGIDFDIAPGETLALLGESGCGKSISALSLLQLVPEPAGRIVSGRALLRDQDVLALPEREMRAIRGKRMAMIFQEPQTSLNPVLTIGEQISEAIPEVGKLTRRETRTRVAELLQAVGIADAARRYDEYPFQLSGGMKQRVMIAMALATEPDLLIADEPTTALDVTIQAQILALLKDIQQKTGMAMLLITHDLGVVAEMADRVAVMYAGQIVELAPRKKFFSDPQHPYSRKLFRSVPGRLQRGAALDVISGSVPSLMQEFRGCRFAERCDRVWDLCHKKLPGWIDQDERGVRCHLYDESISAPAAPRSPRRKARKTPPSATHKAGEALLQVRDLKVHFPIHKGVFQRVVGHVKAVDGVSLDIARGRTLALVGESGCGKTTVGKGILQLVPPTGGQVLYNKRELTQLKGEELRALRRHFQIIFQDPYASLNPRMLVGEILEEGMRAQRIGTAGTERLARVTDLLQQVGLPVDARSRYPHEFSGGQRQRISIARALAVEPELIVCDEPTSALDVSVQAQVLNLLKRLQDELGLSYLFITHNLSVVEYLAHEVAVMYLGRIVERGPVDAVLSTPKHPYTEALLSAVPVIDPREKRTIIRLQGDMPSPSHPPSGCHFHPRCPQAMDICRREYPATTMFGGAHEAHCHLFTTEKKN
ncbi:MAG: ABC transporter ATP-binding protein [Sulfuricaulis sp.]|uniref:ABC transporter ATP-binding protein n=1 Tax=Sulfuricaulis sp. TaxID=2003553 RepID=UPI0025FF92E7|nr:ABC transporter ATP-binding protein [Sulfuricaulis sp.]MCR4346483.1 ABC transporter ATP-binding protein [Sulfuricaulis sp.]